VTILVTGGAGYIGGHMVLALLDAGEQVVVIDDMSNGVAWAIPSDVTFVRGDVGDIQLVTSVARQYHVTAIMHFAARLISPQFAADPLEYYLNNTAKSCALLRAVQGLGITHFVFSSTAAVYGNSPTNPIPETAPLAPISAYGSSKLMTETMLREVERLGSLNFAILRYFNVAGADPAGRYGQSSTRTSLLVQIAVQAALGIRPFIEIYGDDYPTRDGTCIRDYIHVTDLVDAHISALRHLRNGGKNLIVNCGYGRGYSVKEVLDMTEKVAGRRFERRIGPRRLGDVTQAFADSRLISAELDWRPRYDDLATIIEHALRWEKQLQRKGLMSRLP
jgi:UDP-glucose 4-epimerase